MEIQISATFDKNSKRYHRFLIDEGQDVKGAIYVSKEKSVPDKVTIQLKTKADKERGEDEL